MKVYLLFVIFAIHETSAQTRCPWKCVCKEETSNCSRQDLTYFPKFPRQITCVILSYNKLNRNSIQNAAIFKYRNIEILNLKGNRIAKFPFDHLEEMTSLNVLNLGENQLEVIPPLFHRSLEELWLQKNRIREIPDNTFVGLGGLRKLILSYNDIRTIGGKTTFPASLLELNLNSNSIMEIRRSAFGNLKQLNKLSMLRLPSNFKKSDLEPLLEGTPKLAWLKLSGTEKGQFSSNKVFSKVPKLKKLTLRYANIETLPRNVFLHLNWLQELDLSGNNISDFDFLDSRSLQRLDLSYNRIKQIASDDFLWSDAIRYLNLSHNAIRNIESHSFKYMNNAEIIDLSYNSLTSMEAASFNCSRNRLQLHLNHNPWQCSCSFMRNSYQPLLEMQKVQLICRSQAACIECAGPENSRGFALGHNSAFSNGEIPACTPTTTSNRNNIPWIALITISSFFLLFILAGLICHYQRRKAKREVQVHPDRNQPQDLMGGHEYTYIEISNSREAENSSRNVEENPYAVMDEEMEAQGSNSPRRSPITKQMRHKSMSGGNDSLRKYVCMRSYTSQGSVSTATTQADMPTTATSPGGDGQQVKFFPSYENVTFDGTASCKDVYLAPAFQASSSSQATQDDKDKDESGGVYIDLN